MERLSLIFILSALAFVFSFQVAASGPTGVSPHLAAALGAAVIGGAFWWWMPLFANVRSARVHRQPLRGGIAIGAAIAAVPAAVLFFVVSPGAVLPGHDPIIVPTLAQVLLSHATTIEVYRPGDPGFTYPPGYPILFSLVSLVASPLASLIIFKVWTVVLLVLIPVGWAWMASRIFRIRLPYPVLLLLAFVAVFGLERTVSYSLQHGKNAEMLAGALFPGLVALLLMSSRRIAGLPFTVVALTAGILVHYSTLYLAATFFFAWYIVHFPRERAEWAAALRLAVSGALSLALFALILPEAFNDPRAGGFGVPALGDGLMRMADVFLNRHDELLFIFNWSAENNLKSPYRALILTGCLGVSVLIGYGLRRERDDARSVARMAGVFGIMVLLGIAFAAGMVPAGITGDFARWYLIFPQIGLVLATLAGIAFYWNRPGGGRLAARICLAGIFALGGLLATADLVVRAKVAIAQEVGYDELVSVRDELAELYSAGLPAGQSCNLITESYTIADGLHTVQVYKPLEYTEILTPCRMLNGSFVQRGIAGGRNLGDVPDYDTLSNLPPDASIYLVASADLERQYEAAMPQAEFRLLDRKIGPFGVWKMTLTGASPGAAPTSLDALLELIGERLAVMPDVARHKYNSGAAVEDLTREAQVIEAVTTQGEAAGLDKDVAATFFQAQIDASKMIQAERIAVWKAEGRASFTDVPDLKHGDPAETGRADAGADRRAEGCVAGTEA